MIELPARPVQLGAHPVAAWSEPVVIPTYPVPPADRNPMFLEKRVYQGSSGRVYPNPVVDAVSDERADRAWQAVHLENEYVRLMVLPEIGGRIHIGLDRTNGYDFFYRQNVIKPALVGLLGPWISGGVEFNWPQHHRPSSFMPVDWAIEELGDGGRTMWCSEHEPMGRMKGMHGITLRPGSSLVEVQARLFNRTPEVRSFLWWANVCARAHDRYQSFFPPDVKYVFDHAKRAVSSFPVARGRYYGVDYGSRPGPDADLSWYRNIPVPTSYMATGTRGDFFGGYDHAAGAGFVHWADHRVAPGKKQWTWGDGEFGHAWDRELTDADGPYVELMAGAYTDNQPDFSFLMPYETKTFSQYWFPVQGIGPPQAATLEGAVSLVTSGGQARVAVAVTGDRPHATARLTAAGQLVWEHHGHLSPARPLVLDDIPLPAGAPPSDSRLSVWAGGRELVGYSPEVPMPTEPPPPARAPSPPVDIESTEELYLTGLHLAQYHHATRGGQDYWREALRRRPGDVRSNTALGWWHLGRGEVEVAVGCFTTAVAALTRLNPNPYDSEALYGLGLALRRADRLDEADEALAKAAWSGPWRPAAQFARAQLAARRGDMGAALLLLEDVVQAHPDQLAARALRAAVRRRLGSLADAYADICTVLASDPLDAMALDQRRIMAETGQWPGDSGFAAAHPPAGPMPGGVQTALDVAYDYAAAGLLAEAIDVLRHQLPPLSAGSPHPMVGYALAWLLSRCRDPQATEALGQAEKMSPDYCFPARLDEIEVLEAAVSARPGDARGPYYLGNLLYDRRRYRDAVAAWRRAAANDPTFPTVHRNLGLAEFNVLGRPRQALACYRRAFAADPSDARVLYELDQLRRRCGHAPAARARLLEQHRLLVDKRDDLSVEYVSLLNVLGRYEEALAILGARRFHPWEGGEGLVLAQWELAHLRLGRQALYASDTDGALGHFQAALAPPPNLGEGKHLLTPQNVVHYHLGLARRAGGDESEARTWLSCAASGQGDSQAPRGEPEYWRAEAHRALGDAAAAAELLGVLLRSARQRAAHHPVIDYFATSLPTFGVFEDDLDRRQQIESLYLEGLALAGLGRRPRAIERLREVLGLDAAHAGAGWHLSMLDTAPRPSAPPGGQRSL